MLSTASVSQYGPIPAYVHAVVASVFGNTPLVYLSLLAVVSSANVGLAYTLVRRAANVPVAVFVKRWACCQSC